MKNVCLLHANTIYLQQPMDVAVVNDFLKKKFENWYTQEIVSNLKIKTLVAFIELQPIDL